MPSDWFYAVGTLGENDVIEESWLADVRDSEDDGGAQDVEAVAMKVVKQRQADGLLPAGELEIRYAQRSDNIPSSKGGTFKIGMRVNGKIPPGSTPAVRTEMAGDIGIARSQAIQNLSDREDVKASDAVSTRAEIEVFGDGP